MGRECGMHGREEKCVRFCWGNKKEGDCLEELGVAGGQYKYRALSNRLKGRRFRTKTSGRLL
jgi:hypothetical protein